MPLQSPARAVQDHPAVEWTARVGFAAYGAVYLVIGWLTAHLALGERTRTVSKNGALHELAQQPLGSAALWAACAGFAALVVWEGCQVVTGHRAHEGWRRWAGRAGSVLRAGVFAVLAFSAAQVGTGGSSGRRTDSYTAELMRMPFGSALVAAVGGGILVYAAFSVFMGVTDRWREEIDVGGRTGRVGRALTVLARGGYVARGVAFGVVGCLFVWAAAAHDPAKSGGLDQALMRVREAPLGPYLLLVVAVGLAAYGLFNVAKMRFMK